MMIARSSSLCFAAFFLLAFAAQAQDTGVELHGCVKAEGKVQAELRLFAGSNPDPKVFNWAKTDDKGCFVIKGVEPGARRLNVSADGYDFAVKDLQVSTEKVQLLPEIQLEKAVGVLVGRVLDPRGEAVAFAEVMVPFSSRGSLTPPPLRRTSTQVDGTFKLENLPAGSYTFEARHPKYQFLNETIEIKRATVSHDFKLSGEPFQQLTLVALSPKGEPLRNYPITLSALFIDRSSNRSGKTNDAGVVIFEYVRHGRYAVEIENLSNTAEPLEKSLVEVKGQGPVRFEKVFPYASWVRARLPSADPACLEGLKSWIRSPETRWLGGRLDIEKKEVTFHFLFGPGEVEVVLETKAGDKARKKAQVEAGRYGFVELDFDLCAQPKVWSGFAAQAGAW